MGNAATALKDYRWQPGQSGNPAGRPKGARVKLEEKFLDDLLADWTENGVASIEAARLKDVVAYVKIVASILPKRIDADTGETVDRAKLKRVLAVIESAIAEGDTGPAA